jgi:bifunctional non-homologous end joining protein LigD
MAAKPPLANKTPSKASTTIDKQLARYREMRDFQVTSEPSGTPGRSKSKAISAVLPFVIQKHAASRLHYDFRLGWNGVLKSWAVAKGPSYLTADKRLAVQVEDHPIEYGGFEGVIPPGQYGGGTVMIWDEGTWEPQAGHTDVDAGLREGSLKFILHGTRMKGKWALIRMGGKAANEHKPNWLLIKEHDEFEYTDKQKPITESDPDSAVTGRSLEQIAASQDHVWNSKDTGTGRAWYRKDTPAASAHRSAAANRPLTPRKKSPNVVKPPSRAPKESLPSFVPPELAVQATQPVTSALWLHELKLDGYRIQARKQGDTVQLLTRTGLDWTHRMKPIADEVKAVPAEDLLLDGEVVALTEDGNTSFADLQAAFQQSVRKPLTYFVFDLLHLDGHNLRGLPLRERKALLERLLESSQESIRFCEHLESDGAIVFRKACELQAEGIVSKLAQSKYVSGRSHDWLKLKCIHEQEFVVGGFTLPSKGHAGIHGVGALLLGYYNSAGSLIYAGRAGTGFTQKTHRLLRTQLDKLRQPGNPFRNPPLEARSGAVWVKPHLVAQIRFATWTSDNLVRQASFKGLREDKPAGEVGRETFDAKPGPQNKPAASHAGVRPIAAMSTVLSTERTSTLETAPVRLTHPDKILDAPSQVTKQQLADYYWAIAPHMLPFVAHRPLSLVRCPEGSGQPCFFQKHVNHMLPPGIESVDVPDKKTGKLEPYITLTTPEALAALAQIGVLEVHPWSSTNADLEHPDSIIIDLDPDPAVPWRTLADSALQLRQAFKNLSLESFLKTTGGKGLHVVVPIQAECAWSTVKEFAHSFVLQLERANPALYLTKMTKAARKDRIYLDYLRNERGATAVAAYSPRARPGAPVSLPLNWAELKLPERPVFPVSLFNEWKNRLARDPWKSYPKLHQRLDPTTLAALAKLQKGR